MSMIRSVKAGGQQQFAPIPLLEEDSYPGRIIRLVDLGTHPGTEMDGTPKLKKDREGNVKFGSDGKPLVKYDRRLLLTIEIPGEVISQPGGRFDGQPHCVVKEFNESFYESAAWRGLLTTLMGADKLDKNDTMDYSTLLGMPVSVDYGRTKSGKGKVKSISRVAKGVQVPQASNPQYILSLEPTEFNQEIFESLPKFAQDKIRLSPEFANLTLVPKDEVDDQDVPPWA